VEEVSAPRPGRRFAFVMDPRRFRDEAASVFDGDVVVASDLQTVPVPPRLCGADPGRVRGPA
jgi:hypothetical protein